MHELMKPYRYFIGVCDWSKVAKFRAEHHAGVGQFINSSGQGESQPSCARRYGIGAPVSK
jgi:hypothetical protein